jgi:hypothetical protein
MEKELNDLNLEPDKKKLFTDETPKPFTRAKSKQQQQKIEINKPKELKELKDPIQYIEEEIKEIPKSPNPKSQSILKQKSPINDVEMTLNLTNLFNETSENVKVSPENDIYLLVKDNNSQEELVVGLSTTLEPNFDDNYTVISKIENPTELIKKELKTNILPSKKIPIKEPTYILTSPEEVTFPNLTLTKTMFLDIIPATQYARDIREKINPLLLTISNYPTSTSEKDLIISMSTILCYKTLHEHNNRTYHEVCKEQIKRINNELLNIQDNIKLKKDELEEFKERINSFAKNPNEIIKYNRLFHGKLKEYTLEEPRIKTRLRELEDKKTEYEVNVIEYNEVTKEFKTIIKNLMPLIDFALTNPTLEMATFDLSLYIRTQNEYNLNLEKEKENKLQIQIEPIKHEEKDTFKSPLPRSNSKVDSKSDATSVNQSIISSLSKKRKREIYENEEVEEDLETTRRSKTIENLERLLGYDDDDDDLESETTKPKWFPIPEFEVLRERTRNVIEICESCLMDHKIESCQLCCTFCSWYINIAEGNKEKPNWLRSVTNYKWEVKKAIHPITRCQVMNHHITNYVLNAAEQRIHNRTHKDFSTLLEYLALPYEVNSLSNTAIRGIIEKMTEICKANNINILCNIDLSGIPNGKRRNLPILNQNFLQLLYLKENCALSVPKYITRILSKDTRIELSSRFSQ